MVGVADLRCSMGFEVGSQDGEEPVFMAAMEKIQRAADANGLAVLGFAMSDEILQRRLRLGWRAFIIHSDGYGIFESGTSSIRNGIKISEEIKPSRNALNINGTVNGVKH